MEKPIISSTNLATLIGALALFLVTCGCANIDVVRVTGEDDDGGGIRYYRPAPYLLVTRSADAETKGALQLNILYLPDKSQEYAIRTTSGLGSVTADVTLEHGWNLIGINRTIDSKIPETITSLGSLMSALPLVTKAIGQTLDPGLYKIIFDEKGDIVNLKPILYLTNAG